MAQGSKRKRRRARSRQGQRRPPARLVRFEERRRTAIRELGTSEIRIGRDPTCDWIVDYANVSRRHAVVRPLGDRNVVQDLGSTNGLRVNGCALGGRPHVLAPGDVIELTESVVLLYEEGPFSSSTPWIATAIAMVLLLIASIGLYVSTRSSTPPVSAPPSDADVAPPAGAPSATGSEAPRGPDRVSSGTHSRMLPRADVPQSADDPTARPARSPASGPGTPSRAGSLDWTPVRRVPSSGDRGPGAGREGEPR